VTSRPISTPRVVWALFNVARRRWANRTFGHFFAVFRRKRKPGARRATAPKPTSMAAVQAVMAVLMFFGSFAIVVGVVGRMTASLEVRDSGGKIPVPSWFYDLMRLREGQDDLTSIIRRMPEMTTEELRQEFHAHKDKYPSSAPGDQQYAEGDDSPAAFRPGDRPATSQAATQPEFGAEPTTDTAPATSRSAIDMARREVMARQAGSFEIAARQIAGIYGDTEAVERKLRRAYRDKGLGAFSPSQFSANLPGRRIWGDPVLASRMTRTLGLVLTVLTLMLLFRSFAAANLDLMDPSWSLEWFFTFPVRAWAIFAARLLQVTLLNAFAWMTVFPLMAVVLYGAGWRIGAVVLAGLTTLSISAGVAGVQVVGETWLRRRLSRGQLSNVVGLCTILQMLLFVTVMAMVATPVAMGWAMALAKRLPDAVQWLPTVLPISLCRQGAPVAAIASGMLGGIVLIPLAAAYVGQRMVRGGLSNQAGTYAGRRRTPTTQASTSQWRRGFLGKELRLLARDRTFLAQAIILPVMLCILQVLLNPGLAKAASRNGQHAAAVAFLAGAYVVLISGSRLLIGELKGMWLLYTLPHRLENLLFRKISLWAAFGALFAAVVWSLLAGRHGHVSGENVFRAVLAVGGVGIYGVISPGLSALGTDAAAERPRVGATILYLNMLVGATYVMAIYATSIWQSVVLAVLFVLVAAAIWQKVRQRLPYLLDPTQRPPPTLGLSDALLAVFAFFALQALGVLGLSRSDWPQGAILTVAYVAAGLAVVPMSLLIFWRRKIPSLLATVGLRRSGDSPMRSSWPAAVACGAGLGVLAAVAAVAYLAVVEQIPWLRAIKEHAELPELARQGGRVWIVWLAVLAAPVLEEYLFRGLLFQSLRRLIRPAWAIVASAAVFAAIHPPISLPPVFCLGLAAAWIMRRTGLLVAAIAAHMTYNGLIAAASLLAT